MNCPGSLQPATAQAAKPPPCPYCGRLVPITPDGRRYAHKP